jgi:hypothetical protein
LGKSEGSKQLGRPRSRWENDIEIDLNEIIRMGVEWFQVAQDRDKWWAV